MSKKIILNWFGSVAFGFSRSTPNLVTLIEFASVIKVLVKSSDPAYTFIAKHKYYISIYRNNTCYRGRGFNKFQHSRVS